MISTILINMKKENKGSVAIVILIVVCVLVFIGGIYFLSKNKSNLSREDCSQSVPPTDFKYSFSFMTYTNKSANREVLKTNVIMKTRAMCDDGSVALLGPEYDLGTYQGECSELSQSQKDVTGDLPDKKEVARVQCLLDGSGSLISVSEVEDYVVNVANIKTSPVFKGEYRSIPLNRIMYQ